MTPLMPRQPVPDLSLEMLDGGTWQLAQESPETFSLVVFYRGLHCPICRSYLRDLEAQLAELSALGVAVIAVSSDTRDRAQETAESWKLSQLRLAYGLSMGQARAWGLYISRGRGTTSIGIEEPAIFSEPGLFLVRPDGTLFFAMTQTMPFARPRFADVVSAIKYVLDKDYPARGEVTDAAL